MTERQIAEAIKRGRAAAEPKRDTGPLVHAYAQLHRLLRRKFDKYLAFGTGRETGEDLLQELHLLLIQAIEEDRLDDPDALLSFARGIARHIRSRAIERQAQRLKLLLPEDEREKNARDPNVDTEKELIDREQAAELAGIFMGLLGELDPVDREVVLRYSFRGQTPKQVQAAMNLSATAFKMRKMRALARLRSLYNRTERLSPPDLKGAA